LCVRDDTINEYTNIIKTPKRVSISNKEQLINLCKKLVSGYA